MYETGFAIIFLLGLIAWAAMMIVGYLAWQYVKVRWLTVMDKRGNIKWRKF